MFVHDQLFDAAHARRDDREPGRGGLGQHPRRLVPPRRQHEEVARREEFPEDPRAGHRLVDEHAGNGACRGRGIPAQEVQLGTPEAAACEPVEEAIASLADPRRTHQADPGYLAGDAAGAPLGHRRRRCDDIGQLRVAAVVLEERAACPVAVTGDVDRPLEGRPVDAVADRLLPGAAPEFVAHQLGGAVHADAQGGARGRRDPGEGVREPGWNDVDDVVLAHRGPGEGVQLHVERDLAADGLEVGTVGALDRVAERPVPERAFDLDVVEGRPATFERRRQGGGEAAVPVRPGADHQDARAGSPGHASAWSRGAVSLSVVWTRAVVTKTRATRTARRGVAASSEPRRM